MRTSDYLNNPVIAKSFYNVKCTNVEIEAEVDIEGEDKPDLPTVIVQLQIVPYEPYGEAQEQVLHITLRNSPKAQPIHDAFRQIFRVRKCPKEAIGRFGCIFVDTDEFQGVLYSAVHLIQQSDISRRHTMTLEQADRNGDIPWSARPCRC